MTKQSSDTVYTYRLGEKIVLKKKSNEFVARQLPTDLDQKTFKTTRQVSAASSVVQIAPGKLDTAMDKIRQEGVAHHAYEEPSGGYFLITDRVFVCFKNPVGLSEINAFAAKYALVHLSSIDEYNCLFQLTDHTGMNPLKLVVKLTEEDEAVTYAEHDLNFEVTKSQVAPPTDPEYLRQWHLHQHLNHREFDPRSSSRCEDAWELLDGYGSEEVVISATDDGCKLDHPDFDSPNKFAGWGYFVRNRLITHNDGDANPNRMYQSGANHGTAVNGVIGGEADGTHTVGAAPGCRLLPIKWESEGPSLFISDSKILTALNFLADKVDIMSNSWGSNPTFRVNQTVINRITDLSIRGGRRGKGILFLWAAGNENTPIQFASNVPIPTFAGFVRRPNGSLDWVVRTATLFLNNLTNVPGVMHIAALASTAQRSHYSNYGTGIDLCAPSNNVHTYRRITLDGLGITTTTGSSGGVTRSFGGTSSATPLVAGIAGLILSANPTLSAAELQSILKRTANKNLNFGPYPKTPPTNYDPNPSWDVSPVDPFENGNFQENGESDGSWSPWFGHGRVDAAAAVAEAIRLLNVEHPSIVFRKVSNPNANIPDNTSTGVMDSIRCEHEGNLSNIQVSVDIDHTYIGDLRVSLISPQGTQVRLHNRAGGSADNLRAKYTTVNTPGLVPLLGTDIEGEWKLHVQDLAARDLGTLKNWELELFAESAKTIEVEEAPGISIPDNDDNGIQRSLFVGQDGNIKGISVSIDITHTFIGDLSVSLVAPDGTEVSLHHRLGGSQDNLIREYKLNDTPALQAFLNKPAKGNWTLELKDLLRFDSGKLNKWGMKIVVG